jgi:sigma-B regulation protein RsbU (phosphoserine phosphatase)
MRLVILNLLLELIKNMAVLIVFAYILTRTRFYSSVMLEEKPTFRQILYLVIICGLFSVYGTLSGIKIGGAIANIRDLGPMIAGLIGGPWAGLAVGLIGGIHRFFTGGFTYISSSVSTVIAGLAGGLIYLYKKGKFVSVAEGLVSMAVVEIFHMALLLAIERPFQQALDLVESVSLPMVLTDALGMAIFVFIVHNYIKEKETQHNKEMIESELSVAREIQLSIVPKIFPAFPERAEFDIYALLEPAKEVGGDLFDFFLLDNDHLCFTVGDVSGKGVPASLFMAVTKTLLKAKSSINLGPDMILSQVNADLCEDNNSAMFVTVFLGILTISTGEICFSNGGHNPPYILRENGVVEAVPKIRGLALGIMKNAKYSTAPIRLAVGDSLVVYTDGVTEAMNPAGELLGDRRLREILSSFGIGTAKEAAGHILDKTRVFANGAKQSDDITILVLKYLQPREQE